MHGLHLRILKFGLVSGSAHVVRESRSPVCFFACKVGSKLVTVQICFCALRTPSRHRSSDNFSTRQPLVSCRLKPCTGGFRFQIKCSSVTLVGSWLFDGTAPKGPEGPTFRHPGRYTRVAGSQNCEIPMFRSYFCPEGPSHYRLPAIL